MFSKPPFFGKAGSPRRRGNKGFTLVEVLVASTVGAVMLGLAMDSYVHLLKNMSAATAYRSIHTDARKAMAYISRDIRATSNLLTFAAVDDITLQVVNSAGTIEQIQYHLVSQKLRRDNLTTLVNNTLTENVTLLSFSRFTNPGQAASGNSTTYELRCELTVTNANVPFRSMAATDLLQTRGLFRNKP